MIRCGWCVKDPVYTAYHDTEWGVPVYDDLKLFEFILLEGAQAGLSWLTILKRRDGYRRAFAGFQPEKVAGFTERDVERLLKDPSIIRNRLKIESSVGNARAFCETAHKFGSFANYIWSFVDGVPVQNRFHRLTDIPAETPLSRKMSKDLRGRGFRFVGPIIVYSHMQATGMVNDHIVSCFRHDETARLAREMCINEQKRN